MTDQATKGMFFEEFSEGLEMTTPARTVTEADVVLFAGLSGDYNQLHTDTEFAKETPHGQRIAHGLLGLAIASGLAARAGFIEGTALAFTGLTWKFRAPIFFGDTVSLKAKVTRTRPMRSMGGGMVVFAVTLVNQEGKTIQQGEWTMLVRGKA